MLIRLSAVENAFSACATAGFTTSLSRPAPDGTGLALVLDVAGSAQDVVGGDAAPLARQFVAAARAADALQDALADQGLQHRLQMARRQVVAVGQRLG